MAKGEWLIECMVCGKKELGPPHGTTCFNCLDAGLKYCTKCNEIKSVDDFHKRTDSNGFMSSCKTCYRAKRREEQHYKNETDTAYHVKRNEQSRACKARKYATPAGHAKEILRCQERRNIPGKYTVDEWLDCLEAFDYSCAYCGSKHNLTVEHIIAVSKGGYNYIFNIVPACSSCNCSKSDREIVEWYTSKPYYSEDRLLDIHKWFKTKQIELLGGDANVNPTDRPK